MDKFIRVLVDFSAKVLYNVVTRHISHDKAFQHVLREYRKASTVVPLKALYWISHDIVADYYTIKYVDKLIYGGKGGTSFKRMARLWLVFKGLKNKHLQEFIDNVERLRRRLLRSMPSKYSSLEEILDTIDDPVERLAVELSYPTWLVRTLVGLMGLEATRDLLTALNEEKWWIRVNTLKTDVDSIAERLLDKGVVVRRDTDLDYMLEVLDFNEPLHHLEELWRGEIVFQDKASAMVVEALEPEPGDIILDMTAAPGIKDTLIMQLTDNNAHIIAVDVSRERLRRTRNVLKMYGADPSKIELVHADSTHFKVSKRIDKILLDAPCTSSGAIGKDPAIKLHLNDPSWIEKFPHLQSKLLENALMQPGHYSIVYAVCSILHFEGEEQIIRILNKASLVLPRIPGTEGYSVYSGVSRYVRRFFPHLHRTQGFFIAKLLKH